MVKLVNKFLPKKEEQEDDEAEAIENSEIYLKEIRDALVNNPELLSNLKNKEDSTK